MSQPHDSNRTVDASRLPADSLDAGMAAAFGPSSGGPRSVLSGLRDSLGVVRPALLREAEGESAHIVKPGSDAMPPPELAGDRYQLFGEIARGGMGAVLCGRDVDPPQPGQRAAWQGPAGRGDRQLPPGHRTRPEERYDLQQPGPCAGG